MTDSMLAAGQIVFLAASQTTCTVEELLGAGGRAEVYSVVTSDGRRYALKWYYAGTVTHELLGQLDYLIQAKPPKGSFVWPIELATVPGRSELGYVMELRLGSYRPLIEILRRQVSVTFRMLARICFELADSFLRLHGEGLCYSDLSFGSFSFDPRTGLISITDIDIVTIDDGRRTVLGSPRFMAPEVVRREAVPSTVTDLYSLAVIFFYLLINSHPLDGEREARKPYLDASDMDELYGSHPLFIFDTEDDSNRPVPGEHDNALIFWPIYPRFIQELFTRSFTKGLHDPAARVRESEWRAAMIRLHDSIFPCIFCGAENIYDPAWHQDRQGRRSCRSCGRPHGNIIRLQLRSGTSRIAEIVISNGIRLYPHHLLQSGYGFDNPIGEVTSHPIRRGQLGLKNLTLDDWVAAIPGRRKELAIEPGRSTILLS